MKNTISAIIAVLLFSMCFAQDVTFIDPIFKSALVNNSLINTNGDNEIQLSEAQATDSIDILGLGVTDLTGLESFNNLTYLQCSGNQISDLDISSLTQLTFLSCAENQLTEIDVTNNSDLLWINFSANAVIDIDLSQNAALVHLLAIDNQLTSLDVSNNVNLQVLYCYLNNITSLDLSNNSSLLDINCFGNNLSELNINNGNNASLTNFYAVSNPNLFCIQVDDANASMSSWGNAIDTNAFFSEDCGLYATTNEPEAESILNVYPNPTGGFIQVELPNDCQKVELSDHLGRIVFSEQTAVELFDLTYFETGMYLLSIYTSEKVYFVHVEKR